MKPYTLSLLIGLLILPWLNPFAPGPSPAVVPLMIAWFCAAIALLMESCKLKVGQLDAPVVWSWLIAGLVSCALGLLQYFGATADLSPWLNQTRYGEAFANLRQRNQFATLTNISLVALLCLMVTTAKSQPESDKSKAITIFLGCVAGSLLVLGNAASSSRTGFFQLILVCVLMGLWGNWRRPDVLWVLGFAVLGYIFAAFALPYIAGLDVSTHGTFARLGQDNACGSRLILWSNVLHLIAQKPWLGWGWGELDYAHFITLYNEPRFCDILDNAHNLPLHLAVELGVPAAVLICGGFMWWAVRQKPWAERDATRQLAWAVLAVILLHSMLEYPLWYGPFQMAFGLCVLLLWRQKKFSELKISIKLPLNRSLDNILRAQTASILIASVLLVFISYAAWDYRRISQIYLPPESRAAAYRTDTLNKIRSSWLFADQVQFAELLTTPLTPANAVWTFNTARHLLHYSPEPRVIKKLIESAVMLRKDDEALAYLARFRAAFPEDHLKWARPN